MTSKENPCRDRGMRCTALTGRVGGAAAEVSGVKGQAVGGFLGAPQEGLPAGCVAPGQQGRLNGGGVAHSKAGVLEEAVQHCERGELDFSEGVASLSLGGPGLLVAASPPLGLAVAIAPQSAFDPVVVRLPLVVRGEAMRGSRDIGFKYCSNESDANGVPSRQ
eukprot:EG_transcript_20922